MAPRLVAIHQPNFFPWLGFFDKIARADVFVLLDSVQFQKKGGTWTNRVRLLVNGEAAWVTVPVVRSYHGYRAISEIEINDQTPWRRKLLATIKSSYRRAPAFAEVWPLLAEQIENPASGLAAYNTAAIEAVVAALGLEATELVSSSSMQLEGASTDLLVEIVRAVGGDAYLSGGGAAGYQEDEKFGAAGIELVPQRFRHPRYPQRADPFVEGLSVIDALMSCGFDGATELLR